MHLVQARGGEGTLGSQWLLTLVQFVLHIEFLVLAAYFKALALGRPTI